MVIRKSYTAEAHHDTSKAATKNTKGNESDNLDIYVRFEYCLGTFRAVSGQTFGQVRERRDSMVTLTPTAIGKVKEIMVERGEEGGLRIAVIGGGCSGFQYQMSLDETAGEDDQVVEQEGLKLFIDSRSLLFLDGTKVDYVDGAQGAGFKFDNPNSQNACGCGESFEA